MERLPRKMRAREVARTYGIGLSTVWYFVRLGKLKSYKVTAGTTVFDVEELERFFNGEAK